MNSSTLYIIGNGFDLYHELPTSYSDFGNYIKDKNSELHYYLENYFQYVDLWRDFEETLSKLDIAKVFSDNDDLFPDEESDRTGDIHTLGDKAEQINKTLTTGLKNALRDWVLQVQQQNVKIFTSILDKNATFLTFNYTNTLERYKIEPIKITYLHNKANLFRPDERDYLSDDSDIIIGHAVKNRKINVPQQFKKGIKLAIAYEEAFDALEQYYNQSFKNTKQIILDNKCFFDNLLNIEKVIIFGHSLSNVDMPYFKEISKKAINVKEWEITYFGIENLSEIKNQTLKFLPQLDNVHFLNSRKS